MNETDCASRTGRAEEARFRAHRVRADVPGSVAPNVPGQSLREGFRPFAMRSAVLSGRQIRRTAIRLKRLSEAWRFNTFAADAFPFLHRA